MSRSLDDLSTAMQPRAYEWIARVIARGHMVMVVDTLRTIEEHKRNLANGTSGTALSRHLPRSLRIPTLSSADPDYLKSDALDLVPYEVFNAFGPDKISWDPTHPAWKVIIEECERVGLVSGGRWKTPYDPGHGELPRSIWYTRNP